MSRTERGARWLRCQARRAGSRNRPRARSASTSRVSVDRASSGCRARYPWRSRRFPRISRPMHCNAPIRSTSRGKRRSYPDRIGARTRSDASCARGARWRVTGATIPTLRWCCTNSGDTEVADTAATPWLSPSGLPSTADGPSITKDSTRPSGARCQCADYLPTSLFVF